MRILKAVLFCLCAAASAFGAGEGEVQDLLQEAKAAWGRMEVTPAISAWQKALASDPQNAEARDALARLQTVFERTDRFLDVVESLLDKGLPVEAADTLGRWSAPYASRDQQARVQLLTGRLRLAQDRSGEALAAFQAAAAAAESPLLRLGARLGEGQALTLSPSGRPEACKLLQALEADAAGTPLAAETAWALVQARDLPAAGRVDAMRSFLKAFPAFPRREEARLSLSALLKRLGGRATRESLQEVLEVFSGQNLHARPAACASLREDIPNLEDPEVLTWLAGSLAKLPDAWELPVPTAELSALAWRRLASISRGEGALAAARSFQASAKRLLENGPTDARCIRWRSLQAESLLMEGQLLLLAGDSGALQRLSEGARFYEGLVREGEREAGRALIRIGRILASRGRADAASRHYALVARALPADPLGAEALWSQAELYRDVLDRPLDAVEVLARYHDLYPPSFRLPTGAEDRIQRLGYSGVAAFQAAHGLKADGILGKKTLEALACEEENFREILPAAPVREPVQGRFVHDALFQIARGLEARGRFREAVRAYQVFLSLYPGHQHSEDALLAIARIFRANDLFAEASSAYSRLMEDYPNGDKASHAYLEAAGCRELLGGWRAAADLYELYLKKFPSYAGVKDAQRKLAAVRKVMHHADLLADGLPPGKKASALYEMGQVVYKELGSPQKAAGIFAEVADQFPKSYQGPDARFSQGVCLLREENFDAAREAFEHLLKDYPDSRLADDARFWIAHTWEYQARALGRLDFKRVVLKKRSMAEASVLRADLDLRRRYAPQAAVDGQAWHSPHPDLLKAGQARDQVRENLVRAVAEYRRVVADHALGDMAQKALLRVGAVSSDYLHDPDKAIEAYRMLLEKYPGSTEAVDAQFAVGRHYLKKGDLAAAEKAIAQFLAGFPNHAKAAEALLDLADCHAAQKEWQKALDDCQSFLSRWPDSPRAAEVREKAEWIRRYRFE